MSFVFCPWIDPHWTGTFRLLGSHSAVHRLVPIAMAAALALPMAEVRAAASADLKIIRFPGSIQLRLVGMGTNPAVRPTQTDSGWVIEVNAGQPLAPVGHGVVCDEVICVEFRYP